MKQYQITQNKDRYCNITISDIENRKIDKLCAYKISYILKENAVNQISDGTGEYKDNYP